MADLGLPIPLVQQAPTSYCNDLRNAIKSDRSCGLGTTNPIALPGTIESVSVSHLFRLASVQVTPEFLIADEYPKPATDPARLR